MCAIIAAYALIGVCIMSKSKKSRVGKAPYRLMAKEETKDLLVLHSFHGYPECFHCGAQILTYHFIESANNKISMVGDNCLEKLTSSGTLTCDERVTNGPADERKAAREARIRKHPIMKSLFNHGPFGRAMIERAIKGQDFTFNMREIMITIHAEKMSHSKIGTEAYGKMVPKVRGELAGLLLLMKER